MSNIQEKELLEFLDKNGFIETQNPGYGLRVFSVKEKSIRYEDIPESVININKQYSGFNNSNNDYSNRTFYLTIIWNEDMDNWIDDNMSIYTDELLQLGFNRASKYSGNYILDAVEMPDVLIDDNTIFSLDDVHYYQDKFRNLIKSSKFYKKDTITKDIIYKKIAESNKLKMKDTTSGGFSILTIDTNAPIITFEKEQDDSHIFLVDLKDKDEFKYKTKIETVEQLNKAIDFTIEALSNHSAFNKYVDDIEKLKQ